MVGIVQEQHGDRARLFMQWKQMGWPVLVDPLNQLGVAVVPITVFIDERGDVAGIDRRGGMSFEEFTVAAPPAGRVGDVSTKQPDPDTLQGRDRADAMVLWGDAAGLDEAIDLYGRVVESSPGDAEALFRRGVAYRMRFDSDRARPGDFAAAVEHWASPRRLDPNQYIWRRRIQQYGPRLDKPYPFYDWVVQARSDIAARGEAPVRLAVEPGGAEFAQPARSFSATEIEVENPDPEGKVTRDDRYVRVESVQVSHTDTRRSKAARVHVLFRPVAAVKAHWNNEAEPLGVWIDPPAGWKVDRRWHALANPASATSDESRRVEFEIVPRDDTPTGTVRVPAYALYNVCEGAAGTCLYRRQDLDIEIVVR